MFSFGFHRVSTLARLFTNAAYVRKVTPVFLFNTILPTKATFKLQIHLDTILNFVYTVSDPARNLNTLSWPMEYENLRRRRMTLKILKKCYRAFLAYVFEIIFENLLFTHKLSARAPFQNSPRLRVESLRHLEQCDHEFIFSSRKL